MKKIIYALALTAAMVTPAAASIFTINNPRLVYDSPDTKESVAAIPGVCQEFGELLDWDTGELWQITGCSPETFRLIDPIDIVSVTDLQSTLDGLQDQLDNAAVLPIDISDVTGLQSALDSKSTFNGIYSSLSGIPSTFTPSAHTHAASDITSGTLADGRIAQSNVTQHQAALSIASSQMTGTKTSAFISDFTSSARSAISVTGNGSYNSSTGVITVNSAPTRTFNNPTRSLNNCFQISSTQDALVSYSVDIAATLSLLAGQQGTVYARYYDNSGCTTNAKEIARFVNGNTGALTIGLNLTQNATGTLTGMVPAGKYIQLVTENNTGTPVFTYRGAQEVLF